MFENVGAATVEEN